MMIVVIILAFFFSMNFAVNAAGQSHFSDDRRAIFPGTKYQNEFAKERRTIKSYKIVNINFFSQRYSVSPAVEIVAFQKDDA